MRYKPMLRLFILFSFFMTAHIHAQTMGRVIKSITHQDIRVQENQWQTVHYIIDGGHIYFNPVGKQYQGFGGTNPLSSVLSGTFRFTSISDSLGIVGINDIADSDKLYLLYFRNDSICIDSIMQDSSHQLTFYIKNPAPSKDKLNATAVHLTHSVSYNIYLTTKNNEGFEKSVEQMVLINNNTKVLFESGKNKCSYEAVLIQGKSIEIVSPREFARLEKKKF